MGTSDENHHVQSSASSSSVAAAHHPHTLGLLSLKHAAVGPVYSTSSSSMRTSTWQQHQPHHPHHAFHKYEECPEDQPSPVSSEEQAARSFTFHESHLQRAASTGVTYAPSSAPPAEYAAASHGHYSQLPQTTGPPPAMTPVTRFLSKESFGFVPPKPSSSAHHHQFTSTQTTNPNAPASAGFRLPSLNIRGVAMAPPSSASSPRCAVRSHAPPRPPILPPRPQAYHPPERTPSPRLPSALQFPVPPLNPLKRPCPPSNGPLPSLPYITSGLVYEQLGRPLRYQRSVSCPSDAMNRMATATEYGSQHQSTTTQEEVTAPPTSYASGMLVSTNDVPKGRLARSTSVDASTALKLHALQRAAQEQDDEDEDSFEDDTEYDEEPLPCDATSTAWRDAHRSLESLAESANALRAFEQSARAAAADKSVEPSKREKKLCAFPECTSNAVTRGLCISHGGGRRCQRKGCTRGAQSKGLCVAHGGGRICRHKGCTNIQRSMGLCIRHGGGKRCSMPGCQKGVVRQDLCTAHGGKRKCKVEDCTKHVKKKGLCRSHANSMFGTTSPRATDPNSNETSVSMSS